MGTKRFNSFLVALLLTFGLSQADAQEGRPFDFGFDAPWAKYDSLLIEGWARLNAPRGDVTTIFSVGGTSKFDGHTVFTSGQSIVGDIVIDGTVDGRDIATDGSKLDNIEANADVTDATNVAAATAVMDADFGSNGLLSRTGAGAYGIVTDNSANWNTAYGWGNHSGVYIPIGASFAGDVTGTYDATVVGNDSHTHSTTLSGNVSQFTNDSGYGRLGSAETATGVWNFSNGLNAGATTVSQITSTSNVSVDAADASASINFYKSGAGKWALYSEPVGDIFTIREWGIANRLTIAPTTGEVNIPKYLTVADSIIVGSGVSGPIRSYKLQARHVDGLSGSADWDYDTLYLQYQAAGYGVRIGDSGTDHPLSVYGEITAADTIESTSGGFKFPDGTTQTTASVGGGGTLDAAYDFGGSGAGRTITADNGAVAIEGAGGLHINAPNNALLKMTGADGNSQQIQMGGTTDPDQAILYSYYNNGSPFFSIYNNGSEAIRLSSANRFGVGTTDPSGQVHAYGAWNGLYGQIVAEAPGASGYAGMSMYANSIYGGWISYVAADNDITISGYNGGAYNVPIKLNGWGGNVIIGGTVDPDGPLHVMDGSAGSVTSYANSTLTLENDETSQFLSILGPAGTNQGILFGDATSNWMGQVRYNHAEDKLHLYANQTEGISISSSGSAYFGSAAGATSDVYLADQLYDWDDTGYVIDPNGFSVLDSVKIYQDEPTERTNVSNMLVLSRDGPNPYSGFGIGILFKGETYRTQNADLSRIYSALGDDSVNQTGSSLIFQISPLDDGVLADGMRLYYDKSLMVYNHVYVGGSSAAGTGDLYVADRILDWDNTGYYLDLSASSQIQNLYVFGGTYLGGSTAAGTGDVYLADLLYDWDNTAYYVDPNGTSVLNYLSVAGDQGDPHIQGAFGNTGTTYGGLGVYGTLQSHIRFWVGHTSISGNADWQIRVGDGTGADELSIYSWTQGADLLTINGTTGSTYIGGLTAAGTGDLYLADQLYDWDNTGYYIDLNGTSAFLDIHARDIYMSGGGWLRSYGQVGMYNQSYGNWFYAQDAQYWRVRANSTVYGALQFADSADATKGYVYWDATGFGLLGSDGDWDLLIAPGGDDVTIGRSNGNVYVGGASATGTGDLYLADLLYDWDNTGYYVDPNDTSVLYKLNLYGSPGSSTPMIHLNNTAATETSIQYKSAHSAASDWRVGNSILINAGFEWYNVNRGADMMYLTDGGNLYVSGATYGGLSIGEIPVNYEGWDRQLTLNGTAHARLTVKTATVRMGVYAHDAWTVGSPAGYVGTYTNHPVAFMVNGAQEMLLNSTGLGVNTTPTSTLHVKAHDNSWAGGLKLESSTGAYYWNFHPEDNAAYSLMIGNGTYTPLTLSNAGNIQTGTGATSAADIYLSDQLYDWDDTNFVIDPNGTSKFSSIYVRNTSSGDMLAARGSYFGYSTAYKVTILGSAANNDYTTPWFNYDPVVNASGAFGGTGTEVGFNNGVSFITPNSANTSYHNYLNMNNGYTTISNLQTGVNVTIGGDYSYNPYSSTTGARLMFGGGDSNAQNSYYIGTNMEDYGGNYNKLDLRWHTGIRMGAQPSYGGIRFYDTEALGTVVFSINTGTANARATNTFYAPNFYDSDNTGYYVDPYGTSVMNVIQGASYGSTLQSNNVSDYGQWYMAGNPKNGYYGLNINNMTTIMHDGNAGGTGGIYNDYNNQWVLSYTNNGDASLYYAGAQKLYTGSDGIRVTGWIYNTGGYGLYNSTYSDYFYSESANYWRSQVSSSTGGIKLSYGAAIQGYLYHDTNGFGLLNSAGSWVLTNPPGSAHLILGWNSGNVSIGGNAASGTGDIYLADQLYDWDNTAYYIDPNGFSRMGEAIFSADDMTSNYETLDWGATVSLRRIGTNAMSSFSHAYAQLELVSNTGYIAGIAFHNPGVYGANFALDTDNNFSTYGWSASSGYTGMKIGNLWVNGTGYVNGSAIWTAATLTNNNQLSNGAGYITDGNTGWDNSYGYITDGNTNWDNSYGYITTASGTTITDIYNHGWWRNYGQTGLYNQSYDGHFYMRDASNWVVTDYGIQFRDTHEGTLRGTVYNQKDGWFGLLSSAGAWMIGSANNGVYLGLGNNYAIYVGGAYSHDTADLYVPDMIYSWDTTGYYIDIDGTSNQYGATFNQPITVGAPTASGHAATKNYVDTQVASAGGGPAKTWTKVGYCLSTGSACGNWDLDSYTSAYEWAVTAYSSTSSSPYGYGGVVSVIPPENGVTNAANTVVYGKGANLLAHTFNYSYTVARSDGASGTYCDVSVSPSSNQIYGTRTSGGNYCHFVFFWR